MIVDHLSRIEKVVDEKKGNEVEENFHEEQLFQENTQLPWYVDLVNYLAFGIMPHEFPYQQKKDVEI